MVLLRFIVRFPTFCLVVIALFVWVVCGGFACLFTVALLDFVVSCLFYLLFTCFALVFACWVVLSLFVGLGGLLASYFVTCDFLWLLCCFCCLIVMLFRLLVLFVCSYWFACCLCGLLIMLYLMY